METSLPSIGNFYDKNDKPINTTHTHLKSQRAASIDNSVLTKVEEMPSRLDETTEGTRKSGTKMGEKRAKSVKRGFLNGSL